MPKNTNRLKVLRAERSLSQLDTALKAGIPSHRYWLIENGYRDVTPAERARLTAVFGVGEDEVFPPHPDEFSRDQIKLPLARKRAVGR